MTGLFGSWTQTVPGTVWLCYGVLDPTWRNSAHIRLRHWSSGYTTLPASGRTRAADSPQQLLAPGDSDIPYTVWSVIVIIYRWVTLTYTKIVDCRLWTPRPRHPGLHNSQLRVGLVIIIFLCYFDRRTFTLV